jgi:AcrR family transcriptional regulator
MNNSSGATRPGLRSARRAGAAKPPTKHQQRTEKTKRVLLQSARLIFAREGFEACRIEDIAAAAGFTRGAFYAHFETKEELFFALLREEIATHAAKIRALLEKSETADRRWAALREYYVQCISDREWVLLMLEFKLFAVRHPKLRPRLATLHRRIRSVMDAQVSRALLGVETSDQEPKSAALEGIMAGLFLEHAYDPERLSERRAAEFLGEIFDSLQLTQRSRK